MTKSPDFFESIHLLRGIAAFLVVIDHNFGWYSLPLLDPLVRLVDGYGQVGVTAFFVISGFVLPLALEKGYRLRDFGTFLWKRIVRIEPTYLVSMLVAFGILTAKVMLAPNAAPSKFSWLQFGAHFFYLIPFTVYPWYNEVYWTLAIEFQFYLLIGIMFPLLRRGLWQASAVLVMFSALVFLRDAVPQVGLLSRAPIFAIGLSAFLARSSQGSWSRGFYMACGVGIGALYASVSADLCMPVIAIATAALILWWRPGKWKIRYLGDISYSLYVIHYPIVFLTNQAVRHFLGNDGHPLLYLVALGNLVLVVLAAHMVYVFVELPSHRWSKRIAYKERRA
jgi:peptidoglycan/LPS O-acetylase OafA/YrhL